MFKISFAFEKLKEEYFQYFTMKAAATHHIQFAVKSLQHHFELFSLCPYFSLGVISLKCSHTTETSIGAFKINTPTPYSFSSYVV